MPVFALKPHPANRSTLVDRIEVEAERTGTHEIALRFQLMGDLNLLQISPPRHKRGMGVRRAYLWETTCFESFCRPTGARRYAELNLATSGDWAAYLFEDRRAGMVDASAEAGRFRAKGLRGGLQLSTSFILPQLGSGPWELGLSAVVEDIAGTKSYWALAHPPGPPDFHNPACFIATLPAPERP